MNKATFIKDLVGWTGHASLYKLDEPLDGHEYVIVSATNAMFTGPETYIFPSTEDGECEDFGELEGSFKGDLNHYTALRNAGYEVE